MKGNKEMTGYKLAKKVNQELEAHGLKAIPPQMVYQYIAKGYIPSHVDSNGQRLVAESDAYEWMDSYVERRTAKAAERLAQAS